MPACATVYDALLRDVLEHPEDDTPRLILADWLDETGEHGRAEFLRVQCAIARICRGNREGCPEPDAGRLDDLISREAALMGGVWELGWLDPVPARFLSDSVINRGFLATLRCPCDWFMGEAVAVFAAQPITRVELTDRQPYRADFAQRWGWFRVDMAFPADVETAYLPLRFYDLLPAGDAHGGTGADWMTREGAETALSHACVLYGRRLAGLEV